MRALAVYPSSREVRLIESPEPRPRNGGDVLARVLEVGICGTDREIARFEYGAPPPGEDHLVLGHESLTEVLEVGPEVHGLAPGDLAVPMVRRPCSAPTCAPCRYGRADFCTTGDYEERGINRRHGYMTERIVDDVRWFVRVPRALRDVGVLVEPLTVAEKGIIQGLETIRRFPWIPPDAVQRREHGVRAVVIGAGAVGLLAAMAMQARGFVVWLWSLEPEGGAQARLVESFGARYRSTRATKLADLAEEVGNIGFFLEATGAAPVAFEAMPLLGTNGVFCLTGVPGRKGPVPIDAGAIMKSLVLRNQLVYGTVNAGHDAFSAAVEDLGMFVERWPKAIGSLVSSRHALEEIPRVLVEPPVGIKSVVRMG